MQDDATNRASTGVAGLDQVTNGGLTCGNIFLLEGSPGTGKTTIAMQFLMEGVKVGDVCLYVTLSETPRELREGARSHGWTLDDRINIFEVTPPESLLDADQQQSLLYSSDFELGETTKLILEAFERVKPQRVVLDSLAEIRLLAQSSLRYRRQILAFKHYFARHNATVLMLDDMTSDGFDKTVHSIVHGVIKLEEMTPNFGAERRRLRVTKYRGNKFIGGYHDFVISLDGVAVFPRLVASEHRQPFQRISVPSGIAALDQLLGGGIEQGSSTLVLGPAGTGKSTFLFQFIAAAIARGEKAAYFVFDEELGLLFNRTKAMGFDLETLRAQGKLYIEQVDAAEMSPGEFAHRVSQADAKTVAIDSLNGYQSAMPEEKSLVLHIHGLIQHLNRLGASTFLTIAQHGLLGDMKAPVDITYLADTVILLRYFEALGNVRRAVSVIKKRTGHHEDTIREYRIGPTGLILGEPLREFQGILRGVPDFVGGANPLLNAQGDSRDAP